MKTTEQKIAEQELKLARLKQKAKKERDGALYVIGGLVSNIAKKDKNIREWLIKELENLSRKQDKKRVISIIQELKKTAK